MTTVHGSVQHHPHGDAHHHEREERRRHVEQAPGREPLQSLEARRVTKPFRLVIGDEPCQTAIQQQTAQRDDEWLQSQARNQPSVDPAKERAEREHDHHGRGPGNVPLGQHHRQQHPEQGERRPDGQIDTASDDHQAESQADNPERPDQSSRVLEIRGRQEAGVERGDDGAQHDQQQERREFFLHVAAILSLPRPRSPCRVRRAGRAPIIVESTGNDGGNAALDERDKVRASRLFLQTS